MIAIGEYTISAIFDGDSYVIQPSVSSVVIEDSGTYNPSEITFNNKHKQGTGELENYSGRLKIETTSDNTNWTTQYTSSSNEVSKTYSLPSATVDKESYNFRKSPVASGSKSETIVGGSLAWNQLVDTTTLSSYTVYGFTFTPQSDGSIKVNGTRDTSGEAYYKISEKYSFGDHVVFLMGTPITGSFTAYHIYQDTNGQSLDIGNGCIYKQVAQDKAFYIRVRSYTESMNNVIFKPQVIDLTALFGTTIADYIYSLEQSSAGAGVAWVKRYIDLDTYHEYDAGSIQSVEGLESHDTVGFNQWDEEWEVGSYNPTTGEKDANPNSWRSKNPIPIIPNTQYYFYTNSAQSAGARAFWYDADGNYMSLSYGFNALVTPPSNARFLNIRIEETHTSDTKLCINLSDPSRNGTYEPYEKHSYPLDPTVKLNGVFKLVGDHLEADGDVYPPSGEVQRRYGTATFNGSSSERWFKSSRALNGFYISMSALGMKEYGIVVNSYGYPQTFSVNDYYNNYGRVYTDYTFGIDIDPSLCGSTVESFKTYLASHPITIVYELATPTTETAQPFQSPMIVGATEEYISDSVVPVGHESKYTSDIKNIRASLYKAGGTTALLNQITIPVLSQEDFTPKLINTIRQYTKSTSSTSLPSNPTWVDDNEPTIGANEYLWARLKHVYSDGTFVYSNAVCSTSISGAIHDVDKANKSITDKVWESDITTKINQYDGSTVSTIRDRVTSTEQNISGITSRVSDVESSVTDEANQRKATYGTCDTGAGTAAKAVTCENFELRAGSTISVKFTNTNTTASPTLNVNSTGIKAIKSYTGQALTEGEYKWAAGSVYDFIYDGQYWRLSDSGSLKRITSAESSITQNADNIELKVSKDSVISTINQSPESVTINANKVNIEGAAIFSSGRLSQTNLNNAYDAKGSAAAVQTNLDNLEINSNNLLRDTRELYRINNDTTSVGYLDAPAMNDNTRVLNEASYYNGCRATHYITTSSEVDVCVWKNLPTPNTGDKYTLSFLIKGHGSIKPILYAPSDNSQVTSINIDGVTGTDHHTMAVDTDSWRQVWVTWTFSGSYTKNRLLYLRWLPNSDLYMCMPKLVKGGVASDWSPSPYDKNRGIPLRNYFRYSDISVDNYSTTNAYSDALVISDDIPSGTQVTISVQIDATDVVFGGDSSKRIGIEGYINSSSPTQYIGIWQYVLNGTYSKRIANSITLTQDLLKGNQSFKMYIQGVTGGSIILSKPKLEIGYDMSPWSSAPEDNDGKDLAITDTLYYRSTSSTTPTINTSTSIGTSNNTDNAWEYVNPIPKRDRYFFTCEKYTHANGSVTFSTVRALDSQTYTSKWVSSSDQTYIDGGSIYTHSITTSQLATDAIKSTNYLAGGSNSPYSSAGTFLDLSNGNFYTPNFGVQSLTGKAYLNGEIIATSGSIGDDSGNYWEIGNTTDSQGNGSASIVGNGTAYIQDGDWQIHSGLSNYSNGSINTQWYTTPQGGGLQLTYPYYDGYYYDYGMTSPVLDTTSSRFYNQTVSQNFLYIRKHASTIPTLESDWNYIFRVDKDGMVWINGQSLTQMIQSGVDGGAYLPTSGGTVNGNVTITGTLTATASKANQLTHTLSINGKGFDGSGDVNVGTIGAAYGGTGQTSLISSANALLNALSTGSDIPKDNDYYISQYVNGGTSTTTYHRRPVSKLWEYIKSKLLATPTILSDTYVLKSGDTITGSLTVENGLYSDSAQLGDLIVTGSGRFANGLYGNLTGNADTATMASGVADSGNGTKTTFAYSKSGLSTASWIAAWSGYELRAISSANTLTAIGGVAKSGDTMTGTLTAPEFNLSGGVNDTTAGFRLTNNGTNMDMGWTWTGVQGAGACFTSSSHPNQPGIFDFFARAKNSSNQEVTKHLIGNISGVLTWDGRRVVTATNSTAVGGTSTPIYIDANGYAQACTSISATSATKATQDADGNTISSTYLKLSGGTVTGITQFNKTIRDSNGQHYFGGAANRTQWYVITLAHNGVTPPSTSAQWYMCSMSIHLAGDYQNAPNGTIELSYYIYWDKTEFHAINVYATGYGPNINKVNIYYNLTNPFILYVDAANAYTTIWVDRVSYRDSAQSHNTKETKVQQSAAITVDDYSQIPIASIHTYNGTHLTTNSTFYPDVDNTHNLGTSDKKWSHIYATTFDGNLSGNASSASKLNSTRSFTVGNTAKNVDWSGAVSFTKAEISDEASSTTNGWMSVADKKKLDSITVSDIGTIGANSIRGEKDIKVTISSGIATIGHENSAITAGTISGTATSTLSNGGSFKIPSITYDAYGHITGTAQTTITLPNITSVSGNAGTATAFSSNASVTLTGDTTGTASSTKGWSITTKTDRLSTVGDNRSVATTPNDYVDKFIFQGLKYNNKIDYPVTGDTYSYLFGFRGYGDSSGGKAHELAFNGYGIFTRMGSTTTWDAWRELLDSSNYTDYTVTKTGTGASGTWGISISGNATTATSATESNKLKYYASLTTDEAIDGFLEANRFKTALWTSTSSVGGVANGVILSGGYSSTTYGFQLAIDDDPTYFIALRQKNGNGWADWKRIPMADGTGASGNWSINANTATTAEYSYYPKFVANNELRFDVNSKPSSAINLCVGYKWSDGTSDAKINRYNFYNGGTGLAEVGASTFYGDLSGNATSATKATQDGDGNTISSTYLKLSGGTMTGTEKFNPDMMSIDFRDSTSYRTGFYYGTSGNEALALAMQNAVTSFMVVHGSNPTTWSRETWNGSSPTLQTKQNSVYVNELITSGTTPAYNFKVNGTSYLGGDVKISDTNADTASVSMVYDRDMGCLNFIFN